ncbi:MAG: DNA polymerase III subunit beta [Alkaliphilus sp.]
MKFKIPQNLLMNSLSVVLRGVSNRTTLPILKGILIEAKNNRVKFISTDLEIGIQNEIDAFVIEEGTTVIDAKLFSEIIRKMPDSAVEIIKTEDNNLIVRSGTTEFIISTWNAKEYPELPQIKEGDNYLLGEELFKSMIKQTVFSTAQIETKPVLKGVLFEIEKNKLNMVALDGYRLALRKGKINTEKNQKVVIPAKTLSEVSRILNNEEKKEIEINIAENHVIFDIGKNKVISRLLEGEFINYKQIIPTEFNTNIIVETKKLIESLERASLISTESKKNLVKMNIVEDKIIILSNSELGKGYEEIEIEKEGNNIEIAFNSKYIIEALKVIEEEKIVFSFTTNIRPGIIKPKDNDNYVYLILPVRISGS